MSYVPDSQDCPSFQWSKKMSHLAEKNVLGCQGCHLPSIPLPLRHLRVRWAATCLSAAHRPGAPIKTTLESVQAGHWQVDGQACSVSLASAIPQKPLLAEHSSESQGNAAFPLTSKRVLSWSPKKGFSPGPPLSWSSRKGG